MSADTAQGGSTFRTTGWEYCTSQQVGPQVVYLPAYIRHRVGPRRARQRGALQHTPQNLPSLAIQPVQRPQRVMRLLLTSVGVARVAFFLGC